MARYALAQSSTWGGASTWDTVANTPLLIASDQTVTTTPVASQGWTAPNTTNAVTGVLLYLASKGTANTITVVLQEATVNTAATQTINLANVNLGYIYFRFPTPYVYTAVTANRYRITTAVDTGTCAIALAAVGSTHFMATDDRHATPGLDNVFVVGHNDATPVTVTVDGLTRVCGNTNVPSASGRAINQGFITSNGGAIVFDQAASSTLTATGASYVDVNSDLIMGTVGSPMPAASTATLVMSGAAGNAPLTIATGGRCSLQGAPKSSTSLWKGTLASGVGTAASPLVLNQPVDWIVGDEIVVSPGSANATNYNETETRFIITKNSATSYVLSGTAGGSELALTNTHAAGTLVTNIGRNVVLKGLTTGNGQSFNFLAQPNTTNIDIDWARFENVDPTLFFSVAPLGQIDIQNNVKMDYTVGYYGATSIFRFNTKTTADSHTGIVTYSNATSTVGINPGASGGYFILNCQGQTFNDCYSLQNGNNGFVISASFTNVFNRCQAYSSNHSNNIVNAGAILSVSAGQNTYSDCEVHANRGGAIRLYTALGESFVGLLAGTKAPNQATDILPVAATFNDVLFDGCTFGSTNMITGYQSQTIGSEIRFNRLGDVDNVHRWYTVYGYAESEQTIIRSPGLSVKIVPENATIGFSWSFQIPVGANSSARFPGFFLKNAALGTGVTTVSMFLPGNPPSAGLPDKMTTLTNVTGTAFTDADEQSVDMATPYTQNIPGAAVIVVNVKSTTPGAALYCDDFFNGGNKIVTLDEITGLNLWVDGKPLSVISPSVPSAADTAAAVWAALAAEVNISGTMGAAVLKALTTAKYIGLS